VGPGLDGEPGQVAERDVLRRLGDPPLDRLAALVERVFPEQDALPISNYRSNRALSPRLGPHEQEHELGAA
jgi:hypothetical protein